MSASDELGTAAALAEQGFLAAGRSLEQAVAILDRLVGRFGNYVGELSGHGLADTQRELTAAGSHMADLTETRQTDAAAILALGRIVQATGQRVAALQPITRSVATLSLNARIIAGDMGVAAAEFGAFAGDIRDAAQHAQVCLELARDALAGVASELAACQAEMDVFGTRHGTAMQAIPARLAGNLRSLLAQQQLAAEAATAAHRRAEEVRAQVATQVMALQLGDITRQRLEHVQAALAMTPAPQRLIGELLAAQLTDTADELAREGNRIEAGLRHLAAAAREIGELGTRLHGEARGDSFITALESDLRQTATLFGELSAGDAANDRRMETVLQAAEALAERLGRVQSVQEDIRLMGLNATLKCGRLGVIGRPLAAVAQELRLCSSRFGANAASVLHDLDQLRPIASGLRDPSRRGKHAAIAQATDDMLAPLQRLDRLESELAAALAQLQADADAVGQLAEAAVEQFAVRHALAGTLRKAAAECAAWPDSGQEAGDLLDRIATGYTMAREREVHARFAPLHDDRAEYLCDVLF